MNAIVFVLLAGAALSGECDPRVTESPLATLEFVFNSAASQAPEGTQLDGLSGSPLKSRLAEAMTTSHRGTVNYSAARRIVFQQYTDERGRVWDVYGERWARLEWLPDHEDVNIEHIWPQSRFKTGWAYVGRSHNSDPMKSDLHNLLPTDSGLNNERGNEAFGEVGDCPPLESCQDGRGTFEPPDAVKGNIARALFYMSVRYGMEIPGDMELHLRAWHELDPADPGERARHEENALIQGNRNYFIDDPSLVTRLGDF